MGKSTSTMNKFNKEKKVKAESSNAEVLQLFTYAIDLNKSDKLIIKLYSIPKYKYK